MIIEISKLSGAALDWAVAKANDGWDLDGPYSEVRVYPAFSLDWAYAGPLIESENISVYRYEVKKIENVNKQTPWLNKLPYPKPYRAFNELYGPKHVDADTYLEAAMRCYVLIKLGEKVDIPKELTK